MDSLPHGGCLERLERLERLAIYVHDMVTIYKTSERGLVWLILRQDRPLHILRTEYIGSAQPNSTSPSSSLAVEQTNQDAGSNDLQHETIQWTFGPIPGHVEGKGKGSTARHCAA